MSEGVSRFTMGAGIIARIGESGERSIERWTVRIYPVLVRAAVADPIRIVLVGSLYAHLAFSIAVQPPPKSFASRENSQNSTLCVYPDDEPALSFPSYVKL